MPCQIGDEVQGAKTDALVRSDDAGVDEETHLDPILTNFMRTSLTEHIEGGVLIENLDECIRDQDFTLIQAVREI